MDTNIEKKPYKIKDETEMIHNFLELFMLFYNTKSSGNYLNLMCLLWLLVRCKIIKTEWKMCW